MFEEQTHHQPRFNLMTSEQLQSLPPLNWRVRSVLPATGLAALYGPSGSGKSFLALDLVAAISEGLPWFGHRVQECSVVYAALEGEAGFRKRVEAWEKHYGRQLPGHLKMLIDPFKLVDPEDVDELGGLIDNGSVVVIDTLNRAAPVSDENSSKDMGLILEGAKRLQRQCQGLVLLVHHTGKDAMRGMRGHSSLHAALDAAVEVARNGELRQWTVVKSKDGADGAIAHFNLEHQILGHDEFGEPESSCTVQWIKSPPERGNEPQGGNQKLVFNKLKTVLKEQGYPHPERPAYTHVVELEQAVDFTANALTCEQRRRGDRARAAITGLIGRKTLAYDGKFVWLTERPN